MAWRPREGCPSEGHTAAAAARTGQRGQQRPGCVPGPCPLYLPPLQAGSHQPAGAMLTPQGLRQGDGVSGRGAGWVEGAEQTPASGWSRVGLGDRGARPARSGACVVPPGAVVGSRG